MDERPGPLFATIAGFCLVGAMGMPRAMGLGALLAGILGVLAILRGERLRLLCGALLAADIAVLLAAYAAPPNPQAMAAIARGESVGPLHGGAHMLCYDAADAGMAPAYVMGAEATRRQLVGAGACVIAPSRAGYVRLLDGRERFVTRSGAVSLWPAR